MADEMIEALQAMEANEPQANLYRAAEEYVSDQAYELMGIGDNDDFNKLAELMKQAVIYGAHWKEQQIIKDAKKGLVCGHTEDCPAWIELSVIDKPNINVGDKVKVYVIKEN